VIKEVPREPSGIERGLMMVGILAIMIIIICVVWKLRKFLP
jgi:flagellar biogenesis protein FliO